MVTVGSKQGNSSEGRTPQPPVPTSSLHLSRLPLGRISHEFWQAEEEAF